MTSSALLARIVSLMLLAGGASCRNSGGAEPPPVQPQPPTTGGTRLTGGVALYPRAIRLAAAGAANGTLLLSVVTFPGGAYGEGHVFESVDDGVTWSTAPVGIVRDTSARGLCCATVFELPTDVGPLRAGTLLWAASVGQEQTGRRMALRVWKSGDRGRTWSYLSSCANASNTGGLWEPEFSVSADGRLVCHYSDETLQPAHSQVIARVVSADGGATWSAPVLTVASATPAHRPGMPVVRRLPDGTYVMSYEICGLAGANCATFMRTSANGLEWGDPAALGRRIISAADRYFAHTPVIAVGPNGPAGEILLIGQLLQDSLERQVPGSGGTLMKTAGGVDGPWIEVPAPFTVTGVYDNYCPNYSSSLLPSSDGARVLLVATAYVGTTCTAFYGTGPAGP